MIQHFVLEMTGAAQNLLTAATPSTQQSEAGASENRPLRELWLQARGTNNNPTYVGADEDVTSTNYGFVIPPGGTADLPATPIRVGPFESGPVKLSDFWVIGSDGEFLHVFTVPF